MGIPGGDQLGTTGAGVPDGKPRSTRIISPDAELRRDQEAADRAEEAAAYALIRTTTHSTA